MFNSQLPEHRSMRRSTHIGAVLLAAGIALGGLLAPLSGHAQYPSKPIKLIASSAPGTAPDTIARVVGERLSPPFRQPIIVENRAGSNGNIAMDLVAKSAPDGYTLIICTDSNVVINPHLYAKMLVDTLKDLVPVATVASNTLFLSVHPSVPVTNFQEFIEYAKKANPPLAYASAGSGSLFQMAMEMLKVRAGIDLVHVPYKGAAAAAIATIAGEVPAMFSGGTSTVPYIRAGRLRGLAVTGHNRSPLFPELPTLSEFYPSYHMSTWLGIFAPAGLPDAVIARLRADINRVLAMPEVKERLYAVGGLEPYVTTPQEFAALIRADYEKYGKLVKQIGAKAD